MHRKTFLILLSGGIGSILVPASLYVISPNAKEIAVKLIAKNLDYLRIKPGSIENYVDDYFKSTSNDILLSLKWKVMDTVGKDVHNSTQIFELVKYFLLSSNFFVNKADEKILVDYVGLFSPYTSPAPNPFSFILYPSTEDAE